MQLPTGTVTLLFTDVVGSTQLWEERPEAMREALPRHDAIADAIARAHEGMIVRSRGEGDSLFIVFPQAPNAVVAAADIHRALQREPWPDGIRLRVRMAVHTAEAQLRDGDYYGSDVNRAARLRALAHPEQILVSQATKNLAGEPGECRFRPLGEHRLKDLDRPETVFQLLHPELPDNFPELKSAHGLPGNLPSAVTSFVGRNREIEEVKQLLEKSRLVTLTGSGGCGKTRLALQVARQLRPRYPDGAWLVDLTALSDPALVADAVRESFGFADPGEDDIGTLVAELRSRTVLVVIDGCEHLLDACGSLCERLLTACPGVSILATSRQGMAAPGERTYRVPSLSVPGDLRQLTAAAVRDCEAIQLFVERARNHRPDFAVTDRNASHVAAICRRLDGIPLAIELAAARTRSLTVEEISARLDERFRLLVGSASSLPRQQTLEALIDWSYALLTPPEKLLLDRLAVFTGGWTLHAAEGVCADEADLAKDAIVDLLTSLVDKSLVAAETENERTRYSLLETVREYARARLEERGEMLALRRHHRDYYLKVGFQEGLGFLGDVRTGVRRFQEEQGNLRQALASLVDDPEGVEGGLRLVPSLAHFWAKQERLKEGGRFIAGLLTRAGPETDSGLVNQAKHALGRLVGREASPALPAPTATARILVHKQNAHQSGNTLKAALCAYYLADASLRKGDLAAAREGFEEAAAGFHSVGDEAWLAAIAERLSEVERRTV